MHHQDETHVETTPYLGRVWPRIGRQPTVPAAGTNRRLTVFGSTEVHGRGRVEVLCAGQDSACFERSPQALEARHQATGRKVLLVLDNGPAHRSKASQTALAARAEWLEAIWLARSSPEFNAKEREWGTLKRDHRRHLAPALRAFGDGLLDGLGRLGGERQDIVDDVPGWWLEGHRKPPTGRPPGRPKRAKDAAPRQRRSANLPAPT